MDLMTNRASGPREEVGTELGFRVLRHGSDLETEPFHHVNYMKVTLYHAQ